MNKIVKKIFQFLIEIAIGTILVVGIKIFTDGMWLLGLPELNDIQSVSISYPNVTDEIKKISNEEDIELALKLTGFLNYDLFERSDDTGEPLITITYHLQDGTDKIVSANHTTVWWNGKSYSIKDKEIFINLTEGLFFLKEIQAK